MEKKETMNITSHEVTEALEQIRAGFTISRQTLGACTLLFALCKKDEKWAKKFTKIQNDYHKFLLDTYTEMEKKYNELIEKEKENENNIDTNV